MTAARIEAELVARADPDRAATTAWFFQMGPGGYGEGDSALGVRVPEIRRVVRRLRQDAAEQDVVALWDSDWHEVRLAGCVLACELAQRGDPETRRALATLLLAHTDRIDNWDLVDTVAPTVLGGWLLTGADRRERAEVLDTLAASASPWERRIAVVATLALIRAGEYADTLRLATALLDEAHPLVHKATGWMLREVGQRNRPALNAFLDEHHTTMPRVMLRYALEKHDTAERDRYLGRPPRTGRRGPPSSGSALPAGGHVSTTRRSSAIGHPSR